MPWRVLFAMCLGWVTAAQAESLVVYGGDTYVLRLYPWKRAYENTLRGDGAIVGLSMTPERQALVDFSEPLYLATAKSMQKKDALARFNKALHELERSGQLTVQR